MRISFSWIYCLYILRSRKMALSLDTIFVDCILVDYCSVLSWLLLSLIPLTLEIITTLLAFFYYGLTIKLPVPFWRRKQPAKAESWRWSSKRRSREREAGW